jgi:hypothetical protein
MIEAEWNASKDPDALLDFLQRHINERKLRLWACACCRRIWHLLPEPSRELVETAEQFADNRVSTDEMLGALRDAEGRAFPSWNPFHGRLPTPSECARAGAYFAGYRTSLPTTLAHMARQAAQQARTAAGHAEGPAQCDLLREIYSYPLCQIHIEESVRAWNDGTVVRLARHGYRERSLPAGTLDADRLAVLADALEDAGCGDEHVLAHLRSGAAHIRGCWALDAILDWS